MTYDYINWIENPHELCTMAADELAKIRKQSCVKAICDINNANKKRAELIKAGNGLVDELFAAYDSDDTEEIIKILEKIAESKEL